VEAIFSEELIDLDVKGETKADVIATLAHLVGAAGRTSDVNALIADVLAREAIMPTGFEGVAIPHARSAACTAASVVVGRRKEGIDFGADDGDAHLIFMIVAPADGDDAHLTILAALARRIIDEDFRAALLNATSAAEVLAVLTQGDAE
jgi:fructose-specific phosphotransferase system IIA component